MSDQDRLPQQSSTTPPGPNETAKINYTETGYGNDHGSITFGRIDETASVTSAVMLQAPDGRHQLSLDKDGIRKGCTTSTSLANFSLRCGIDKDLVTEAQDTLALEAENGNIIITASNGKIRLQGTDIEIIAVGEGGAKGNIRIDATETIQMNSKKYFNNSVIMFRISTVGIGEISANTVLNMYGSIIRGVTDAVYVKDSKVGGQFIQRLNNILTAVNIFTN